MTNEVQTTSGLAALATGLKRAQQSAPSVGGKRYLSFKEGVWRIGKGGDEVNGERVLFNPMTYKTGYTLIQAKPFKALDEIMLPVTAGMVDVSELEKAPQGCEWKFTREIEGRALQGDKLEFIYGTSSYGGNKAMEPVIDEVLARVAEGLIYFCPIVELNASGYEHGDFNNRWIDTPDLTIVGWADMEGNPEGQEALPPADEEEPEQPAEEKAETEEEADEPPVRRRRRR